MIQSETDLLTFLTNHAILYTRTEHPPVYTCEQSELYRPGMIGLDTKNLFLRDERRNFYLLMTACSKRVNLKTLGRSLGAPKLHFASEADLLALLGLTPGSVTVLGLVNDAAHQVTLLVDGEFWPSDSYLAHPLVNTATLVLGHADLLRFLEITGHAPRVVEVAAAPCPRNS